MKLTNRIAQPFVEALEEAFPYKVTITDADGYIVGSSDPERLNQFHASAFEIISGRQPIEVLEDGAYVNLPEGVILGYGEKIEYAGECIGLIGLIGPPEERKKDIKTAQFVLRLLLDREQARLDLELAMADRNAFIVRLLHGVGGEQEKWLENRARLYGIDLNHPRQIVVVRAKVRQLTQRQPIELSKIKQRVKRTVCAAFGGADDLIYEMETGEIVVLTGTDGYKDGGRRRRAVERKVGKLYRDIQKQPDITASVGVSQECGAYQKFSAGFQCALAALELGELTESEPSVFFYEQMRLSRIAAGFTPAMRDILYEGILKPLLTAPRGAELIETLQAYFKNNLSTTKTAEGLFIHRNTLQYRFKRIKEITGCDVWNTDEMILLRLAVLQNQFFGCKETAQGNA